MILMPDTKCLLPVGRHSRRRTRWRQAGERPTTLFLEVPRPIREEAVRIRPAASSAASPYVRLRNELESPIGDYEPVHLSS